MTQTPDTRTADQRSFEVREAARREIFRLARDDGARLVTGPAFSTSPESAMRQVEPLAGGRAARDLELAARDYIRHAREAGHRWDQIGHALAPAGHDGAAAEAAYTYAAGPPDSQAPWQPRSFSWTCWSCDQLIADHGQVAGPADDEHGHADNCRRHAAAIAAWTAEADRWQADWEAGQ
jgi:hypothetical protein